VTFPYTTPVLLTIKTNDEQRKVSGLLLMCACGGNAFHVFQMTGHTDGHQHLSCTLCRKVYCQEDACSIPEVQ